MKGRRAEKRKPRGIRDPWGSRRAPLGAPVAAVYDTGPRFRPAGPKLPASVSQLLAGPLIGPGRSPGAARVSGCEPDPQAPHLVPPLRTPREAPLQKDEVMWSVGEVWRAGIKVGAPNETEAANAGLIGTHFLEQLIERRKQFCVVLFS